jgi:hypothetical protein
MGDSTPLIWVFQVGIVITWAIPGLENRRRSLKWSIKSRSSSLSVTLTDGKEKSKHWTDPKGEQGEKKKKKRK